VPLTVAWRRKIFDTFRKEHSREDHMMSPESQALYDEWENKIRSEGIKQGRKEGRKAGRKAGERALVRKQLTLRFGALPADAEQRINASCMGKQRCGRAQDSVFLARAG
jgi:predicted transposase YdaD